MDATIYAIVLHPALHDLLHSTRSPPTPEQIGWYGSIIFSIFLIGWAIGGITFGILADRFGRTKVLIATIIIYAVFTGAAALSETWWHLAIYRFLTALGIGGEWAAGAAIVAETWPEEKRVKAAGVFQSAWAGGGICPNSIQPDFVPPAQDFASMRDGYWPPPRRSSLVGLSRRSAHSAEPPARWH